MIPLMALGVAVAIVPLVVGMWLQEKEAHEETASFPVDGWRDLEVQDPRPHALSPW